MIPPSRTVVARAALPAIMYRRRTGIAFAVLIAVAAIAAVLFLRAREAPEPARLLPEADAFIYINFSHVRAVTDLASHPVSREPEYQDFVDQTGFEFERDLDAAAVAVHPPELNVANGTPELQRRFSEVFTGHYDATRVGHYLHKLASSVESYGDRDIFLIPHEGRSVRVVLLGPDIVAISNTSDPAVVHGIIDRYHKLASPFAGPELLRGYYKRVPLGSSAWAILKMSAPNGQNTVPLPGGVGFTLPAGAVTVASVRYLDPLKLKSIGSLKFASLKDVEFRVEAFTRSDADAKQLTDTASTFLQLFRSVEASADPRGPDPDVKAFFDSIAVRQKNDRAILTASVPPTFFKKLVSEAPSPVESSADDAGKAGTAGDGAKSKIDKDAGTKPGIKSGMESSAKAIKKSGPATATQDRSRK